MAVDYEQLHAVLHKDDDYQRMQKCVQECHKEQNKIKAEQRRLIRRIIALDAIEDLAMERMNDCEDDEQDEMLKNVTANDSEGWFWRWSAASDVAFEQILDSAVEISNLQAQKTACKDRVKVQLELMDQRRDVVEAELNNKEQN